MERIARALEMARQQRAAAGLATRRPPVRERAHRHVEQPPEIPSRPIEIFTPERTPATDWFVAPQPFDLRLAIPWRPDPVVLERHRIVTAHDHPAAAAYRMLRTQVLQRMRSKGRQVMAIASTGPEDGKSVTTLNLAYVLAADPKCTVVVLDLDLRQPSIGGYLGLEELPGIDGYLRGECELAATTARLLPYERLYVVPARAIHEGSAELLATDAVRRLFEALRKSGPDTLILCDVPPLFAADDLLTLAPVLDCLLLVVGERQTDRDLLRRALDFLPGVPLLGTVLNKSRDRSAGDY